MRYLKHDSRFLELDFPLNLLASVNKDDLYVYPDKTQEALSHSIRFDRSSRMYLNDLNENPLRMTENDLNRILNSLAFSTLERQVLKLYYEDRISLSKISKVLHYNIKSVQTARDTLIGKIQKQYLLEAFNAFVTSNAAKRKENLA